MLGADVKIADKAKVEGQEGVEAGGRRLQHGDNVYGPGLAFADCMRSRHAIPHACTPATCLSHVCHMSATCWSDAVTHSELSLVQHG